MSFKPVFICFFTVKIMSVRFLVMHPVIKTENILSMTELHVDLFLANYILNSSCQKCRLTKVSICQHFLLSHACDVEYSKNFIAEICRN